MKGSPLAIVAVLLLLVVVSPGAAATEYGMTIWSADYQPGHPVLMNITGEPNMTFTIRITDFRGDILAGRDAALDETGNYSYSWTPSQDGDYNATVQFSIGLTITKGFLIQSRVTPEQLGQLYLLVFALAAEFRASIADVRTWMYTIAFFTFLAFIFSGGVFAYARKRLSRADTEFEKFLKEDIKTQIKEKAKP